MLELARLIGNSDPFAPEAPKAGSAKPGSASDGRLADVSRAAAAQAVASRDPFMPPPPPPPPPAQDRSYEDRSRRGPDFGEQRVPAQSSHPDVGDGLDFLRRPERDDYSVAPRHAADERDYDRGGRQQLALGQDDHPDDYREGGYADGEYGMEHDDDYDDDERGARRRRPTKVVMAVLGLAVFGSAAAFGYRTVFNNAAPSGPTPVILADKSPTRMTPMSDAKPDSGRFGDRLGGEQLVRRDEDPVDIGTYRSSSDAAGQFPQDATGGVQLNTPNIMPATPGAVAPPADTKRVQTVAISADSGTSSRSRGGAASAQIPSPSRQVTATQPSPPSPPPQRQAALAPPATPGGASSAAAADPAPTVESGGYVVQLSAVRSEADAQTAFRQLQTKYPVLSGRQPLIRRKDQGDKGIFFAAQVGPFGVKSDADQLCEQLKSAGGSCYVLRN